MKITSPPAALAMWTSAPASAPTSAPAPAASGTSTSTSALTSATTSTSAPTGAFAFTSAWLVVYTPKIRVLIVNLFILHTFGVLMLPQWEHQKVFVKTTSVRDMK